MAVGITYSEAKKRAWMGFLILLIVTIGEVGIALIGNGHVFKGFTIAKVIMYPLMIGLSVYKAYFIVKEFMHMGYELKGLVLSVVLPFLLLVWAVIAFLYEGNYWNNSREGIKQKNELRAGGDGMGMIISDPEELPEDTKAF